MRPDTRSPKGLQYFDVHMLSTLVYADRESDKDDDDDIIGPLPPIADVCRYI